MTGGFTSFNAHKYDRAPTRNSDSLLTSGTIYEALQNVSGGGGPVDPEPVEGSDNAVSSGGVYDALEGKQDALIFDTAPVQGSTNPVTSDGIYNAIRSSAGGGGPVDPQPVEGSDNAVSSGGVYDALAGKQDALSRVSVVSALRSTDYLFIERNGSIYRILASAVFTPSEESGDRIESENGEALLTESGDELLLDISEDA